MPFNGLESIFRTRRYKAAVASQHRADGVTIDTQQGHDQGFHSYALVSPACLGRRSNRLCMSSRMVSFVTSPTLADNRNTRS